MFQRSLVWPLKFNVQALTTSKMASGANKNFGSGSGTGTSNTSNAASHSQSHQSRHYHSSRIHGSHSHHHHHHKAKHSIHWFRKGLRLSDNPALRRAMTNRYTYSGIFYAKHCFFKKKTLFHSLPLKSVVTDASKF